MDIIFISLTIVFFLLTAGLAALCDELRGT
jgi:hypothetical protein